MGEESVVLEDHVDGTGEGRVVRGDRAAADGDGAGVGGFEACDEAERGAFSGTAGAEDGEEFAAGDIESEVADDGVSVEGLGDRAERDGGVHGLRRVGELGGQRKILRARPRSHALAT